MCKIFDYCYFKDPIITKATLSNLANCHTCAHDMMQDADTDDRASAVQ